MLRNASDFIILHFIYSSFPTLVLGLLACFSSQLYWKFGSIEVGRTPWSNDLPCRKAAAYTRLHEH
jgi:hypothetical protein